MSQKHAVEDVLTSRDQMMALEGVAGAEKTTSLAAIRERGYDSESQLKSMKVGAGTLGQDSRRRDDSYPFIHVHQYLFNLELSDLMKRQQHFSFDKLYCR